MAGSVPTVAGSNERVLEWRIACPACGGCISVHDGSRILHCTFCGERHLRNRAHVLALEVSFRVDLNEVAADIKRWLRSNGHRATSMGEPYRLLVPYWRTTGKRLHWTRASDVDGGDDAEQPETRIRRRVELRPAFEGADSFPTDDELPIDFGHATPFDSKAVPENVLIARPAEDLPFDIGADPQISSPDDSVLRCELDRELALLYFPFVVFRYTFRQIHHTVIACGVTGRIFGRTEGDVRESIQGDLPGERLELRSPSGAPPDPLGCPECGHRLQASENALHHACVCGRDWALDEAGVREVTCRHVPGSGEALPFWCFELRLDRNGRSIERCAFVPAFDPCPPSLYRRLSVGLTSCEPEYETTAGAATGVRAWPCRLPMSEARRTIGVLTRDLWENSELSEIGDVALVWITFESRLGFLVDPVTGVRMPHGSPDAEEDAAV